MLLFEDLTSAEPLHEACTFQIDGHVRKCAVNLQDERLLAKMCAGNMVAIGAKYYARCLARYYNKATKLHKKESHDTNDMVCQSIAFAELVCYIKDVHVDEEMPSVFRLAELRENVLLSPRSTGAGTCRVNSTHLKNRILREFPDMTEQKDGKAVALRSSFQNNLDDEAVILSKATKIVRWDMHQMRAKFTGSFEQDCQKTSLPTSLPSLVGMVLDGPDIKSQSEGVPQAVLSIAQLVQFNSCIQRRDGHKNPKHNHYQCM